MERWKHAMEGERDEESQRATVINNMQTAQCMSSLKICLYYFQILCVFNVHTCMPECVCLCVCMHVPCLDMIP